MVSQGLLVIAIKVNLCVNIAINSLTNLVDYIVKPERAYVVAEYVFWVGGECTSRGVTFLDLRSQSSPKFLVVSQTVVQ